MIPFLNAVVLSGTLPALGCQGTPNYPGVKTTNKEVITSTSLHYIEIVAGSGEQAEQGMLVTVHYTGYLMDGKNSTARWIVMNLFHLSLEADLSSKVGMRGLRP